MKNSADGAMNQLDQSTSRRHASHAAATGAQGRRSLRWNPKALTAAVVLCMALTGAAAATASGGALSAGGPGRSAQGVVAGRHASVKLVTANGGRRDGDYRVGR